MDALVEDIGELGEDFGMTRGYWVTIQFNSFLGDYGWEISYFQLKVTYLQT